MLNGCEISDQSVLDRLFMNELLEDQTYIHVISSVYVQLISSQEPL